MRPPADEEPEGRTADAPANAEPTYVSPSDAARANKEAGADGGDADRAKTRAPLGEAPPEGTPPGSALAEDEYPPEIAERPARRWVGRLLLAGAVFLALLALALPRLSVVLTNHLLQTEAGRDLVNRRPDRFAMSWQSGSSSAPGEVSLQQVSVRGQSARAVWQLEADELSFEVSLPSLLVSIFETKQVRGRGVRFFLHQLASPSDSDSAAAPETGDVGYPPIDRLVDPLGPPPGSTPEGSRERSTRRRPAWLGGGRPWTFDFHDLVLEDVRQVWIQRQNVSGEMSFSGTMRFALRRYIEFRSLALALHDASLHDGEVLLLEDAVGSVDLDLTPIVPRRTELPALARSVSGRVRLTAHLLDLGVLRRSFASLRWLDVDVEGALAADIGLERGMARSGSFVRIDSPSARVRLFDQSVLGAGRLEARFVRSGGEAARSAPVEAEVDLVLDEFAARPRRVGRDAARSTAPDLLRGRGLVAHLFGTWPALDQVPILERGTIALADTEVPDIGELQRYLPSSSGVLLRSGAARLGLQLEFDGTRGAGTASLQGERLRLRVRDVAVRSNLDLQARLADLDLQQQRVSLAGTALRLHSLVVEDEHSAGVPKTWWARSELAESTLSWQGGAPQFDARFRGTMRDSRPLVAYYLSSRRLLAPLVELLTIENLQISGDLHLQERQTRIECFTATGKQLEINADFDLGGGRPEGIALFEAGRFRLGLEAGAAQRDWKLLRPRRWFAAQRGGRCGVLR